MNSELDQALETLRREYLAEAPARLGELRKDISAFLAGEQDASASLLTRFHRLAGSGGSYGFPEVSRMAREAEQWLRAGQTPGLEASRHLDEIVARIAEAFDRAGTRLDPAQEPLPPTEFGWCARVVAGTNELRSAMADALRSVGYEVQAGSDQEEASVVPVSETPDFVVISADERTADPYALAAAWSGRRTLRPRSIVMVDPQGGLDPYRLVAAGVDAVIRADRIAQELPEYAKMLARVGTPPPSVLLVGPERGGENIVGWLRHANFRVTHTTQSLEVPELLARYLPDLVLLDGPGLEPDPLTLTRMIRQDPRFSLLPIILLSERDTPQDRVRALRAGADHFVGRPPDRALLIQLVTTRASRGRQIRELVHRDGLTGLLNHATLRAELDHALEYARRHQEQVAFLMIDVDHFKRVNDTHGHLAGDQVLRHIARVFQATVRASDIVGRYGGEEFGMILRRTTAEGAAILGRKLLEALASSPATTGDGLIIPVRVSVGVSAFPDDGDTANALTAAADRALYGAKSSGRDRVSLAHGIDTRELTS